MELLNTIKKLHSDKRILFAICAGLICFTLCIRLMYIAQYIYYIRDSYIDYQYLTTGDESDNKKIKSEEMINPIEKSIIQIMNNGQDVAAYFSDYESSVKTIAYAIRNDDNFINKSGDLLRLGRTIKCENIYILDRNGNTLLSAKETNRNFTRNIYNELRSVFLEDDSLKIPISVKYGSKTSTYYAAKVDQNREIVIEVNGEDLINLEERIASWDEAVEGLINNINQRIFVISKLDYRFNYPDTEEFKDIDAIAAGIDIENLKDKYLGIFNINGTEYIGGVIDLDKQDSYVILAMPTKQIHVNINQSLNPNILGCFVLVIMMVCYALFLRREKDVSKDKNRIETLKNAWKDLGLLAIIGTVFVTINIGLMSQILHQYQQADLNSQNADKIVAEIEKNEKSLEKYDEEYMKKYIQRAQIVNRILSRNPDLINSNELYKLSDAIGVESIELFNKEGELIVASNNITGIKINNKNDNRYSDFIRLLLGVESYVQKPMDNSLTGDYDQKIGISMKDNEGNTKGAVIITILPDIVKKTMNSLKVNNVLKKYIGHEAYLVGINTENNNIFYATEKSLIGNKAQDIGITKGKLRNGYVGYYDIYGTQYYGKCATTENYAILDLTNANSGVEYLNILTIECGVIMAICILCILYPALYFGVLRKDPLPGVDLTLNKIDSITAEKRLSEVFKWIYMIVGFILILCLTIWKNSIPIFKYIVSNDWENDITLIAVTNCIIIIICAITIETVVKSTLKSISKALDSRSATICRLLKSLSQYATLIIVIYLCLTELGVEPGTLLASAGIMSLAISFGAQSLMADILAGLFIIFEGNCKVGDIVFDSTGFRGLVTDIGIRTSKLRDDDFNVKIINNSDLRNIINATNLLSLATCDVKLHSYVDYEIVENAIRTEMESFHERIPQIVKMDYRNVIEVDPNYITIRVCAFCDEKYRPPVERAMFKELRKVFEKYDLIATYSNIMIVNEKLENVIKM